MTTMFIWRSEACRNYARGHVAVVAATEDEARIAAREALIAWSKESHEWIWMDPDPEDRDKLLVKIDADLAEPSQQSTWLVVEGSS